MSCFYYGGSTRIINMTSLFINIEHLILTNQLNETYSNSYTTYKLHLTN